MSIPEDIKQLSLPEDIKHSPALIYSMGNGCGFWRIPFSCVGWHVLTANVKKLHKIKVVIIVRCCCLSQALNNGADGQTAEFYLRLDVYG